MQKYASLDVHSKDSVFAVEDVSGQVVGRGKTPTTVEGLRRFRDEQDLPPGTPVALESGINAFFVVDVLVELGLSPVVIDAAEVRAKASRPLQKSDHRDALELVEGLRRGIYRNYVWVPPPRIRLAREILSRRRHFVRLRTMQVNAAKRLLRGWGHGELSRSLQSASGWEKLLKTLAADPVLEGFARNHYETWLLVGEQVRKLDTQLEEATAPDCQRLLRLQTVPGVGRVVAATFLAVVGNPHRFPGAKSVASYAGLVPSTFQSGERDRHGHITRRGSSELRSMLCEAAHHAQRSSSPLHPFFVKIRARRGYRMAITAVAHRLCRMLYAIHRDGTTFDLAKARVEEGQFEKISVRKYREITATT